MIPLAGSVLPTYMRCAGCADDGNVGNCIISEAGLGFIGLPMSYAKFKPPLHSSGAKRLREETQIKL